MEGTALQVKDMGGVDEAVADPARVGSPMASCQALMGSWEVKSVEKRSVRSSKTSRMP